VNWPEVPLEEVVTMIGGGTPSKQKAAFWSGDIPWISPKDMSCRDLFDSIDHITEEAVTSSATQVVPTNAVLLVVRSGILARKVPIGIARRPVALNQDMKALVPNPRLLDSDFLAYLLESRQSLLLSRYVKRGATVHSIQVGKLREMPIPVPPLSEQRRIVEILDQTDALRKKRAEADTKAARILPALFYEMFGDPATNPMGWPIVVVESLFAGVRGGARCGPFGSALKRHEYVDAGVPVWGIPNVLPNRFVEEGSLFITASKFSQLRAYSVESGDLLVSRAGTVGRICVARPTTKQSIIGTNLVRLALDGKRVTPEFLAALLTHFGTRAGSLRANADEGAYSFMNTGTLKKLEIFLPPIKLQQEFAARVAAVQAMDEQQAKHGHCLEVLTSSLLHRAFTGDLTTAWRDSQSRL
jgi:type I restriction enzyme S subunit